MMGRSDDITGLLAAVSAGEAGSAQRLLSVVSDELRTIAAAHLGGRRQGSMLQTTELVNEAYLRLFGKSDLAWENRRHFFFAAARAMRDIVVEYVRRGAAQKRGGHRRRVAIDLDAEPANRVADSILHVDEALDRLREHDERSADVVLLRFFGGYTNEEVARLMGLSIGEVRRDWAYARAWLKRRLVP